MTAFSRSGRSSGRTGSSSRPSRDKRKDSTERKTGDKKPYRKREERQGDNDGQRSWKKDSPGKRNGGSDKRYSDRKPVRRREESSGRDGDERQSSDFKKPYRKREGGSDRKFGERKPIRRRRDENSEQHDNKNSSDFKKPFRKRHDDSDRKYSDRKPIRRRREDITEKNENIHSSDFRKPFRKREGSSDKSYSNRKPYKKRENNSERNEESSEKSYRRTSRRSDDRYDDRKKREGGYNSGRRSQSSGFGRKDDFRNDRHEKRFDKRENKRSDDVKGEKKDDGLMRLNRYISSSGQCSRRQADDFIRLGLVSVNGVTVTEMGIKVKIDDVVKLNGETIRPEKKVYILMNKPKDYITTTDDPQERKIVTDLLDHDLQARVFPVGRLDRNTTGVLLLTNDGDLAMKLMHPSNNKKKIYHVFLDKNLKQMHVEQLLEGIDIDDGIVRADAVQYAHETDKSQVGIELHSGKYHVIKRMFEFLGYNVIKLDRVYFAGLTKKGLERGKWRFLTDKEINMLKIGAYE